MAKKSAYYIYSTLTADQVYRRTGKGGGDLPITTAEVFIRGGSNVADKRLITPQGVVTGVDEEEMTVLQENEVFKLHEKNGYIRVEKRDVDPEVVAADMELRDESAPLVDADFADQEKPKTNAPADDGSKAPASKRKA